jgi:hypothetical protein
MNTTSDIAPILGLKIELRRTGDSRCRCGSIEAVIGEGKAMHQASLRCIGCDRHRGWASGTLVASLLETTRFCGHPTSAVLKPISQEFASANGAASSGASPASITHPDPKKVNKMNTPSEADFNNQFGSKWFKAIDLNGQVVQLKIGKVENVYVKEKDGSTREKMAIYFNGVDKPLILNPTNANRLAGAFGKAPNGWFGKTVEVYSETTTFGEGVRLRPLKPRDASPISSGRSIDPEMDDPIPF